MKLFICHFDYSYPWLITRASVHGKPESENATDFLAKGGVIVPGVPGIDRGNWGRERDINHSWQNSVFCEERFGKYRALFIRSSRIQKCRSFSSSFILESQPGKLMLETFSWDNNVNWVDRGTDKNRQSMTSCGFCCYYLEHCSKTNHIAIKLINTKTSMDS